MTDKETFQSAKVLQGFLFFILRAFHSKFKIKDVFKINASFSSGNLPRSGGDAGENLMAVTSACP